MRLSVKPLGIFTIFLLLLGVSHAQFKPVSAVSHSMIEGIQKIIDDYPNQFKNITGEPIMQNPQSTDYRCTVRIDDMEESVITRYASSKKEIYSWQAQVLSTENFNEAKHKFRSIYTALNNHLFHAGTLAGEYETPVEEKKFTSVIFAFRPSNELTKKLRIEVVMENELLEWKIKILVYDRDRDDSEKGPDEE